MPEETGRALPNQQAEILRQLRAARDKRYWQNSKGRYVIDGEARPNRKVREKLIYRSRLLTWSSLGLKLTDEGRRQLEGWEANDA